MGDWECTCQFRTTQAESIYLVLGKVKASPGPSFNLKPAEVKLESIQHSHQNLQFCPHRYELFKLTYGLRQSNFFTIPMIRGVFRSRKAKFHDAHLTDIIPELFKTQPSLLP